MRSETRDGERDGQGTRVVTASGAGPAGGAMVTNAEGSSAPLPPQAESGRDHKGGILRRVRAIEEMGVLVALVAMVAIVTFFHPQFLPIQSVSNLLQQASFYGIIALGLVFVLSMGEIDLSVGGIMGFSAVAARCWCEAAWIRGSRPCSDARHRDRARRRQRDRREHLQPADDHRHAGLPVDVQGPRAGDLPTASRRRRRRPSSSFFTILGGELQPDSRGGVVFAVLTVIIWLTCLPPERVRLLVRAIGSNPTAARLSGYPINRIRLYVAALAGLLCAVSGPMSYAFFETVDPSLGNGLELQVIAAAVIGGTAFSGGRGSVPGALLGALSSA